MNSHPELRLLAIAGPPVVPPSYIVDACKAAEAGGVTAIQLRWKYATAGDLVQVTADLVEALSIPVFVNDRSDVAWAVGAFGVHLGADDLPLQLVRRESPRPLCLGVSIGNDEEAEAAVNVGADYWSIGPFFPTSTKDDAGPAIGPRGFMSLAARVPPDTPVIAIGGIMAENAAEVFEAGAYGIAVSSGVFGGGDVTQASRRLRTIIESDL